MATFTITAVHPATEQRRTLSYDNRTSALLDEQSEPVVPVIDVAAREPSTVNCRDTPLGKGSPRVLKISFGLSCNYACEYCSQRFVPRAVEARPGDVDAFMAGLDTWVTTPPEKIEFWGGEPLVYIKTLRPLAEATRTKYPNAKLSVITNGSLLNVESNDWLDQMGFGVGISHDGPGQHVRGPDPLQDPEKRAAILDLYARLAPKGRISFNAMVNRSNVSRAAIQRFFVELTGDPNVPIGEGGFVDAYDEGGVAQSLRPDDMHAFRSLAFHEIRTGQAANVHAVRSKTGSFINSIRTGRPASSLGQKCGMDKATNIAVDLNGNVLTCQNVSAAGVAPNGESHRIGHVSDLAAVKLNTATHWSRRKECLDCPMLQICQGSCMFLQGPLWERSCDNAYPYICPAGYWTIGYGHLCDPKHPPITEGEAAIYLARDLTTALNATLRYCPVLATEPDGRLAAIVDFTFNLGAGRLQTSTLRRRVNQRGWPSAVHELRRWVYGGGKVLPGLVARREAEAALL